MPRRCTICVHPERVAIDRAIATGSATFRNIAEQHGVTIASVSRHVAQHWTSPAVSTPGRVAQEVVKAVRDQQDRDQSAVGKLWERRLHQTFDTVQRGLERAEADPEAWTQVAKFGMTAASIIEIGMRACGTLAGGQGDRVTVNVEQLVVLPTPQERPSLPPAIDVSSDNTNG